MGWLMFAALFFIVWWMVLFTVLPWGVRAPDVPGEGHERGAPESPDLGRKFKITTFVSIGVMLIILLVDRLGFFSFLKDWLKSS